MDTENSFYTGIIDSLRKLMNDKHLTQAAMADYADTTPSQFSKILKGTVYLSIAQISKIAHSLSMSEIDVMTYPKKYISLEKQEQVVNAWIEQKEYKLGNIMNAWRLTLVGEGKGPGMFDISAFLGKEETIRRMRRAIEVLG